MVKQVETKVAPILGGMPGIGLAMALFISGCAHNTQAPSSLKEVAGRSCQDPEELLDVLSRFSTAVQKGDYHRAISMLVKEDQARMIGPGGKVLPEIKARMDALDFRSLSTDRRIDLIRGRLKGVYDCLPCLDQGDPVVMAKEQPKPTLPATPIKVSPEGLEKTRKAMAADFFRNLQMGRWRKASSLAHPDEWKVFLDEEGNLTELNERRLQAIEECDLDALTLKDGLLIGIVVLLDPPVSDLYLRTGVFFDLLEADRIDEAIAMILESEKKFFLDGKGKPRPDRVRKLKTLDRSEWRRLYLYNDVLLGVSEAAIGYGNP